LALPQEQVIHEPCGRNTAPAIALLCHLFSLKGKSSEVVGVFPADHLINHDQEFCKVIELGVECAQKGLVVTLGIKPTRPAVEFGYIETSDEIFAENATHRALVTKSFHEKPKIATARRFFKQRNFFWNAGIFIFQVDAMIGHLQALMPTLWRQISVVDLGLSNASEIYERVESIPIDKGVMEKLKNKQICIPCDVGWSDVGTWEEVATRSSGQENSEKIFSISARDNYVYPKGDKVYGLVGVKNLMIVDTDDALLVMRKGQAQKVKELVDALRAKGEPAASKHEHVFDIRPWGRYDVLAGSAHYKAKVITVAPHSQLSYQSHERREEHWIVIKGKGKVVLDGETRKVKKGNYIRIPKQSKHQMINPYDIEMQFVEVQLGDYFGEDDITRYKDDYGRITQPPAP
jgi:mannose-1-phosphate guanylyltransferase/mannose-1-phosphate guanylyltransferase/mannose-6-phosphate isomerase